MDLIKTTPAESDPVRQQEYLRKHQVSVAQLDEYEIRIQSDIANPGISWPELAEIATHVAWNWNTANGRLRVYENFRFAVKKAAEKVRKDRLARAETETIRIAATVKAKVSGKLMDAQAASEIDEKYATDWRDR